MSDKVAQSGRFWSRFVPLVMLGTDPTYGLFEERGEEKI